LRGDFNPGFVDEIAIDPRDSNHLFAATLGSGLFEIRLAQ
jgi:hypothetical protein